MKCGFISVLQPPCVRTLEGRRYGETKSRQMRRLSMVVIFLVACTHAASPVAPRVAVGDELPTAVEAPIVRADAQPRIVRIWVSQDAVSTGDLLSGHVTTTTNVAAVYLRLGPRSVPMRRASFGQFAGSFRVPWVPPFLHRSYTVSLVAVSGSGRKAQAEVTIHYR